MFGGDYGENYHSDVDHGVGDASVCGEAPPCIGGGREEDHQRCGYVFVESFG